MGLGDFLDFGKLSLKKLMTLFWIIGTIAVLVASWTYGYGIYLANTRFITVSQGDGWYTGVEVNHLPLGIFAGLFYFVMGVLLWRLVCEAIYIVLNYFKENTRES